MKDHTRKKKADEVILYPIRINRYLALKQWSTRRGADTLIENGQVTLNGRPAKLGDKVNEGDIVEVKRGKNTVEYVYLAYYKPRGIVTSLPQAGEKSIEETLNFRTRVFPIGRLDKDSEGLILLTNDGRVTKRLLEPHQGHEKEYEVEVNKAITESFLNRMGKGVRLEDFTTKPATVKPIDEYHFRITLTEGKKHQIRRMCTKFGYEVRELKRVRIINIRLQNLNAGMYRLLKGEELEQFQNAIGLTKN